ncbi:MAG: O-antigen ligase family protein [Actinomycetota bacterium]|nr:O-antigen ligase family protein [Actinomycetota bacterium]MDA8166809.1 O-antigen ligase family protein [Actinomycetota bacterium]
MTSIMNVDNNQPRRGILDAAGLYLLLAALLTGLLLNGGYFPTAKVLLSLLFIAAAAVELLAALVGRKTLVLPAPFWILAVLTGLGGVSIIWSVSASDTVRESLALAGLLAAFLVAASQLRHPGTPGKLASWLAYSGAFVAAWGIVTYILRMAPYSGEVDGLLRAGSTLQYSNALSCFALMSLPVTGALHRQAAPGDRPLLALGITLETAAVLLTFARFGYFALLLVVVYLVVAGRRRSAGRAAGLAAGTGLAVAVAAALSEEAGLALVGLAAVVAILGAAWMAQSFLEPPRTELCRDPRSSTAHGCRRDSRAVAGAFAFVLPAAMVVFADRSLRHIAWERFGAGLSPASLLPNRLDTFAGAVDAFRVRPLTGSGLGTFAITFQRYAIASYTRFAHNLVLQTAVDTGAIGAALMTAFLIWAAALALRRLLAGAEPLCLAFALTSLIFIAYNMFDWEWYSTALAGWFVVAVAVTAGKTGDTLVPENLRRSISPADPLSGRRRR